MRKIISPIKLVSLIWLGFFVIGGSIYGYVTAVSQDFMGLFGKMPSLEILENPPSDIASEVFTADGVSLGKYFRENRIPATFEELSPYLIQALYATEDIRFDRHAGLDLRGSFRVLVKTVLLGQRSSGGGSTISQQLAKNLFGIRTDENYQGKLSHIKGLGKIIAKTKEWIIAVKLERAYTKKEILTMYLNTVDFGSNAFGIKAAAATFFNCQPIDLTQDQAAILIGLLQAPSKYSPRYNPEKCIERRNVVMAQMVKYKFLDKKRFDTLSKKEIDLSGYKVEGHTQGIATYFRAELQKYLLAWCKEKNIDLYTAGLKIYTTIDSRIQQHAEAAVTKHMSVLQERFNEQWKKDAPWVTQDFKEIPNYIENIAKTTDAYKNYLIEFGGDEKKAMKIMNKPIKNIKLFSWNAPNYTLDTTISLMDSIRHMKRFLQTGMMSMDPHTGHIKAWVGGINFKHFKYDHVKQSRRQPGSTFKPFVYLAAIDNDYSPCYQVIDQPVTFYIQKSKTEEERWQPQNFEGTFSGNKYTLRQALARSINSVAAYIMQRVGPKMVADYAARMGITVRKEDIVPALCLGVNDVSVYELTGAYSTFVNQGVWTEPLFLVRIEDKYGNVLQRFTPKRTQAIPEETAYLMLYMLQGATKEKGGTAMGLWNLGKTLMNNEVAAKTGTTSSYSDGWFVGCTKDLVTAVWVGGSDPAIRFRDSQWGQGARMAMPIWSFYMDKVYDDASIGIKKGYFPKPTKLEKNLNCDEVNAVPDSLQIDKSLYVPPSYQDFKDEF
jgi:penicillin-binding protein 1A